MNKKPEFDFIQYVRENHSKKSQELKDLLDDPDVGDGLSKYLMSCMDVGMKILDDKFSDDELLCAFESIAGMCTAGVLQANKNLEGMMMVIMALDSNVIKELLMAMMASGIGLCVKEEMF